MTNPTANPIRVLGIDPGLNTTGYGVIDIRGDILEVVEGGVVTSKPKNSLGSRLSSIHTGIEEVIELHQPHAIAVEQLYSHYERPQTAIRMGHARGVIYLACDTAEIPVFDYAATQIKKVLTGNGRAPKHQVQLAISRLLGLADIPQPADVADALAIAACHFYLYLKSASLT